MLTTQAAFRAPIGNRTCCGDVGQGNVQRVENREKSDLGRLFLVRKTKKDPEAGGGLYEGEGGKCACVAILLEA